MLCACDLKIKTEVFYFQFYSESPPVTLNCCKVDDGISSDGLMYLCSIFVFHLLSTLLCFQAHAANDSTDQYEYLLLFINDHFTEKSFVHVRIL